MAYFFELTLRCWSIAMRNPHVRDAFGAKRRKEEVPRKLFSNELTYRVSTVHSVAYCPPKAFDGVSRIDATIEDWANPSEMILNAASSNTSYFLF